MCMCEAESTSAAALVEATLFPALAVRVETTAGHAVDAEVDAVSNIVSSTSSMLPPPSAPLLQIDPTTGVNVHSAFYTAWAEAHYNKMMLKIRTK